MVESSERLINYKRWLDMKILELEGSKMGKASVNGKEILIDRRDGLDELILMGYKESREVFLDYFSELKYS